MEGGGDWGTPNLIFQALHLVSNRVIQLIIFTNAEKTVFFKTNLPVVSL